MNKFFDELINFFLRNSFHSWMNETLNILGYILNEYVMYSMFDQTID